MIVPDETKHFLSQFYISVTRNSEIEYPFTLSNYFDSAKRKEILDIQSTLLDTPPAIVVGSLFAKRFSVFVTAAMITVSLYDLKLPLAPSSTHFNIIRQAQFTYRMNESDVKSLTYKSLSERDRLVDSFLQDFIVQVEQIIKAVSSHTGCKPTIMWSLIWHNVLNYYLNVKTRYSNELSCDKLNVLLQDEKRLHDSLFIPNQYKRLTLYKYSDKETFYLRKHCCLAFKLSTGHGYCTTCPKLTESERDKLVKA
ncbi:(2Fe-2S)-binding protein [Alkalihalobacillus sp. NPDC078783]